MAARAHARRRVQEEAERVEQRERRQQEQREFEEAHPPRWVEPTPSPDLDETTDYRLCLHCWEHDDGGRVREEAYRGKWGEVAWEPVQTCGAEFNWRTREWDYCTCFCHHVGPQPMLLAAS